MSPINGREKKNKKKNRSIKMQAHNGFSRDTRKFNPTRQKIAQHKGKWQQAGQRHRGPAKKNE